MDVIEVLAKALWEVVPYDRVFSWDEHPFPEIIQEHYRDRARKLLGQFIIIPAYTISTDSI